MTVPPEAPTPPDSPVPQHRTLVHDIFTALAAGDVRPLIDAMHDDVCWTVSGTSAWSRTYQGRSAVVGDLLMAVARQFAGTYRVTATRILEVAADTFVVECQGDVELRSGQRYDNAYCWVITCHDGAVRDLVEYGDTLLIDTVLEPPT